MLYYTTHYWKKNLYVSYSFQGLHVNITEGIPVCQTHYKTLVNQDGHFHGKQGTWNLATQGQISLDEVC